MRWAVLLALAALAGMTGCATTPYAFDQDGGGFGFWEQRDDFQLLQHSAGLEEDSCHEAGEELEIDDAQALWETLARRETTLHNFGPRRSLLFVLRQVLTRGEGVAYAELLQRVRPLRALVVLRPDGYLVGALTGKPLQRMGMGRVALRDGRLMVGSFEVGAFYRDRGGVFYTVDDSLRQPGIMVGELGLERDWFNAALDGSEDALGELAQALVKLVTEPIRSLEGLRQLPAAVSSLIASSPEYFARYATLPLQEQIREAARLSTHLMMLYGGAAGTATRVGTAGVRLPVLSVSAEGALAIEQVALPVGTTATALGAGVGAVYVLTQAPKDPEGHAGGFKPFTEGNFRENLARLTGKRPEGAHAHHVLPQQFEKEFLKKGINVNDPRFGAWWEQTSHLRKAVEYNRRWKEFLGREPSHEQILQFGRQMGGEFEFQVNF